MKRILAILLVSFLLSAPSRAAESFPYNDFKGADGKSVSRTVGTREGGGGMTAYLMEMPTEWYEQDQALKEQERVKVDERMRANASPGAYVFDYDALTDGPPSPPGAFCGGCSSKKTSR